MLKKILIALLISIAVIVSGTIGYAVGVNNTVKQSSISLEDYDAIDEVCRKATTDASGYETENFTRSDCKRLVFRATGKL